MTAKDGQVNDDIMARMVAEKVAIEQRMTDDARKLAAVEQFISAYQPSAQSTLRSGAAVLRPARSFVDRIDKFGAYGKGVVDAVVGLLPSVNGAPVLTRDLVVSLENEGVEIRGENKVNALSALLARSSQIKGHGRSGWTLSGEKPAPTLNEILGDDEAQNETEPTRERVAGSEHVEWGVQPSHPTSGNPQSGWAS